MKLNQTKRSETLRTNSTADGKNMRIDKKTGCDGSS